MKTIALTLSLCLTLACASRQANTFQKNLNGALSANNFDTYTTTIYPFKEDKNKKGLSDKGLKQIEYISAALKKHPKVQLLVKGHTSSSTAVGNGKAQAMYLKVKLVVNEQSIVSRISVEGVGSDELLPGIDPTDPKQERITLVFTKM